MRMGVGAFGFSLEVEGCQLLLCSRSVAIVVLKFHNAQSTMYTSQFTIHSSQFEFAVTVTVYSYSYVHLQFTVTITAIQLHLHLHL